MRNVPLLVNLREEMNGQRFCSDINNPDTFVTVINVHPCGGGHQVSFNYGSDYNVFTSYTKFMKRYPHQLKEDNQ